MRNFFVAVAALVAVSTASPRIASAQLDSDEAKCVTALHKDGVKTASVYAKQLAACFSGALAGKVADLPACVAATPGEAVTKSAAKGDKDALKRCSLIPVSFGVPAAFDDTISEAAIVHTAGLVTELFGATPTLAGTDAGKLCQRTALKATQKLAAAYSKSFTKCGKTTLKTGVDSDALLPCLDPDLTADVTVFSAAVTAACAGVSPAAALPGSCSAASDATVADCLATRVRCRECRQHSTFAALDSDCDDVDDGIDNDSCSFPVTLSGNAIHFSEGTRVADATVWVLEHPEMTTVTNADGYFEFPGLEEGEEVSLVLEHPDFHPIQNGTVRLGATGAERVTFQAVTWAVYDGLAFLLSIVPDELNACQMVTTVTRVGKSIYDPGAHGEPFAIVSTEPALTSDHGPIYFNSSVLPQPSLTRTSDDGGVLFVQVPPGDYVWTARRVDSVFTRVKSKCRAGLLVNASPPWGLQKH